MWPGDQRFKRPLEGCIVYTLCLIIWLKQPWGNLLPSLSTCDTEYFESKRYSWWLLWGRVQRSSIPRVLLTPVDCREQNLNCVGVWALVRRRFEVWEIETSLMNSYTWEVIESFCRRRNAVHAVTALEQIQMPCFFYLFHSCNATKLPCDDSAVTYFTAVAMSLARIWQMYLLPRNTSIGFWLQFSGAYKSIFNSLFYIQGNHNGYTFVKHFA